MSREPCVPTRVASDTHRHGTPTPRAPAPRLPRAPTCRLTYRTQYAQAAVGSPGTPVVASEVTQRELGRGAARMPSHTHSSRSWASFCQACVFSSPLCRQRLSKHFRLVY